jgi:sugar phosphate isomerase/epimerase
LAELARPYGIKLAFEPIGNKRWCVRSLDQALEIVMAVGSANVGFALDAFNLFLNKRLADIDGIDKLPSNKFSFITSTIVKTFHWKYWTTVIDFTQEMGNSSK